MVAGRMLYIIGVSVWMQLMSSDQRAEFSCIDDEEQLSKNRSPWDTVVDRFRLTATISNALLSASLINASHRAY